MALRLAFEENAQAKRQKLRGSIPDGQRYETVDEILASTEYAVGVN